MPDTPSQQSEPLWLRSVCPAAPKPENAIEVVYADAWDDLCDLVNRIGEALRTLHRRAELELSDYAGSDLGEEIDHVLRSFDD